MRLYKKSVVLLLYIFLIFINAVYAVDHNDTNYDNAQLTPKTWQQVELSYTDVIDDKAYPAEIKLLRLTQWLKENGMDRVGNEVNLSIPEFGVTSVNARVTVIKPSKLDLSAINLTTTDQRPVIGIFKRYAKDVRTYTFKDEKSHVEKVNATPNHPFYVKNKDKFISIDEISASDELVSQLGKQVKLICPVGKNNHCGEEYNMDGKPVIVYNLEVYRNHIYFVSDNKVLVHNSCSLNKTGKLSDNALADMRKMNESKGCIFNYFRNRYGQSAVKTYEGLGIDAVEDALKLHGTGSHAILQSNSGLRGYYNMEHAFNVAYVDDIVPRVIGLDAYRPDFFDYSLGGIKRYARDYYNGSTFDMILFPSAK